MKQPKQPKQPKQLNHWLRKLGYRPERRGSLYFKSKNRHLRVILVDDGIVVELSVHNSEFDRWANSVHVRFHMKPEDAFEDMFRHRYFRALYVG